MKQSLWLSSSLLVAIALNSCSGVHQTFSSIFIAHYPGNCLPTDRRLTDVVSASIIPGTADTVEQITIAQRLEELGAHCQNDQLVDGSGRAIQFYSLQNCWGNPPSNYGELLQQETEQIQRLRESYTVIEMTCNPSGIPYP